MPTYSYRCPKCNTETTLVTTLEAYQASPGCPTCSEPMRRAYGSIGVTFKSPGFYSTDKNTK